MRFTHNIQSTNMKIASHNIYRYTFEMNVPTNQHTLYTNTTLSAHHLQQRIAVAVLYIANTAEEHCRKRTGSTNCL